MTAQLSEVLTVLDGVTPEGRSYLAFCPAHNGDDHPRLVVSRGERRPVVYYCRAGCSQAEVTQALRRRGVGANPPPDDSYADAASPHTMKLVATHDYRDLVGGLVAQKGRFQWDDGTKTFRWRLSADEKWGALAGRIRTADMPLYGSDRVPDRPTEPVLFVEGELTAEACWSEGFIAVTNAGGASQRRFGRALEVLLDHDVVLWPDNDDAGRELMLRVTDLIRPLAASVQIFTPNVPPGGDAVDYFAMGWTGADLRNQLAIDCAGTPITSYLADSGCRGNPPSMSMGP